MPFSSARAAHQHCRRGAIAKETAGNDVGDRQVFFLVGEDAEFDRQQDGHFIGEGAQVIGGAGEAGGARQASQAPDRRSLDVGPQPEPIHQQRIDARCRQPGDGDEEDVIDVLRREAGLGKRGSYRPLAEVDRVGDVGVVALAEGIQLFEFRERHRDVPSRHADLTMQILEAIEVEELRGPGLLEKIDELFLGTVVLRKRSGDRLDGRSQSCRVRRGLHA